MIASDGTTLATPYESRLDLLEQLPEYCTNGYVVLRHTAYGEGAKWKRIAINETAKALRDMRTK
jgi:hypothetical protein